MTGIFPSSFKLKCADCAIGALFFVLSLGLTWSPLWAAQSPFETLSGVARVIDGDTIEIGGRRIRLEGIDAPELAQTCMTANGQSWPCGMAATQALRDKTKGQDIACDCHGSDKYRRLLAICYSDGRELNAMLVEAGWAWAFTRYSNTYVSQEREARAAGRGIWQGPAESAWEFRRRAWAHAEAGAPKGCAIKGNISSKGRIYHVPWSAWYDRVTVVQERGERWFCSESEALAAGWRPPAPE